MPRDFFEFDEQTIKGERDREGKNPKNFSETGKRTDKLLTCKNEKYSGLSRIPDRNINDLIKNSGQNFKSCLFIAGV